MITIKGTHLIGNSERRSDAEAFRAVNPANGKSLEPAFSAAGRSEIETAAVLAEQAFRQYRQTTPTERATFLETIAEEILALDSQLIERCMEETALPEARLTGERMRTVNQLRMFAELVKEGSWVNARIDSAQPDRTPLPKPDIRQMQIALGPVAVFGASNFPLAFSVAGGDTASALAAGCTVVVKAHPLHPGTSELVGRAILKAAVRCKMPEGVFSLVHGAVPETGMELVQHPLIKAVGFTGSFRGGKALFDAAASRPEPIPVYAEMGSVNPVFILPGAMKIRGEKIAAGLAGSFTLGTGQFCTNPGVVFSVGSEVQKVFPEALVQETKKIAAASMLSKTIRENFERGTSHLANSPGVETLLAPTEENSYSAGARIYQTDTEHFNRDESLAEEVFGPSTLLVSAPSKEELIRAAENMEGNLTATLHGTEEDLAEYAELVAILERKVGRLIFNGFPTGVEVCHAMVHGGPFPATTASATTSVWTLAVYRFTRPVCYQDFPQATLPDALKDGNPLGILRLVDGDFTR